MATDTQADPNAAAEEKPADPAPAPEEGGEKTEGGDGEQKAE